MYKLELTNEQCAALEEAKRQFSAWRAAKTGRERIPAHLWKTASDLFCTWGLGINRIARSLRLHYSTLKTKILEMPATDIQPVEEATPTFIEIEPAVMGSDCVIEMEKQSGVKLRMCFRGRADPSVISLGRYFLEDHP